MKVDEALEIKFKMIDKLADTVIQGFYDDKPATLKGYCDSFVDTVMVINEMTEEE